MTAKEAALAVSGTVSGSAEINGVVIDSRKVKKGCLFVAIHGENFDGHDFIHSAFKAGAAAVMSHKDIDIDSDIPIIRVKDTAKALLDLAKFYRGKFDIPIVSLTGSVGKTTTKEMLHKVMSKKYKTLKTQGNLNNEIGLPMTLFGLDDTFEAAVVEMGMNHAGEISRLSTAACATAAIITNIGVSHIGNLGSRENILKAKLEICDGLKQGSPLILNGDDDMLAYLSIDGFNMIKFGVQNKSCDILGYDIKQKGAGMQFGVLYGDISKKVTIPVLGVHNVYNALAAISAGLAHGITLDDCAQALQDYAPEGMRQRIKKLGGITFIEDCYNSSPDSLKAALKTLSGISGGRKIAVIGDMLELDEISKCAHEDIGRQAACNNVDILFTYGEMSKYAAETASENGIKTVRSFDSKEILAKEIKEEMKKDDVILFKASRGMKLEDVINILYKDLES